MSQGLGGAFDRAQQRYDAMMPEEDGPDGPVCDVCEKDLATDDIKAGNTICEECWKTHENNPKRNLKKV